MGHVYYTYSHFFLFFLYQPVSDVKCHMNSWVYGYTAHAYSHDLGHKPKW